MHFKTFGKSVNIRLVFARFKSYRKTFGSRGNRINGSRNAVYIGRIKARFKLSELIIENNLSKRELGREIGVSASSISDWTSGKIQPIAENIFLVADYFKVSADYLLGLTDI